MFSDLAQQCAIEFAESGAFFGSGTDAVELAFEAGRFRYLEHRRIAAQEARITARLMRQYSETRICPRCGECFRVLVHARPGRVRVYCSSRCKSAAMMRVFRARHYFLALSF